MQIVLLTFAFLSIIAAFLAWRRSPLYSLSTTIRLLAAFCATVAAVAAASLAIVNGKLGNSPFAQGIEALITVLIISCGASVLVVKITDRHVARLDPSVKLVATHRHRVQKWLWRLAGYLLINAVAAITLPDSWRWLPLFMGGFVLISSGPALAVFYMMARRKDRGLTAIMTHPWVHWRYSAAEWAQWATDHRDWEKAHESPWQWRSVLIFIAFCGGLFLLGAVFDGGALIEGISIACGLTAIVTLIALVVYWLRSALVERRYRRLLTAPPESYIGDDGIFCNGVYTPWTLSGKYLLDATLSPEPIPSLELVFEAFRGGSSVRVAQRVLITDLNRNDLGLLQEKIRGCCPTAAVRLVA